MTQRHLGIILRTTDYQENASIIKLFGAGGFISVLVRGTKYQQSRSRKYVQFLLKLDCLTSYKEGYPFEIFNEALIIDQHTQLLSDPNKVLVAWRMVDKIEGMLVDSNRETKIEQIYLLFEKSLECLSTRQNPEIVVMLFEAKLLYLLGVGFQFKECCHCHENVGETGYSLTGGGVICQACGIAELDKEHTLALKQLYLIKYENVTDDFLKSMIIYESKLNQFLQSYYEHYLGYNLRGEAKYKNLRELFEKQDG